MSLHDHVQIGFRVHSVSYQMLVGIFAREYRLDHESDHLISTCIMSELYFVHMEWWLSTETCFPMHLMTTRNTGVQEIGSPSYILLNIYNKLNKLTDSPVHLLTLH
jgi:hypothetical protein